MCRYCRKQSRRDSRCCEKKLWRFAVAIVCLASSSSSPSGVGLIRQVEASHGGGSGSTDHARSNPSFWKRQRLLLPVVFRRGFPEDPDDESFLGGVGRELDLFDSRGGGGGGGGGGDISNLANPDISLSNLSSSTGVLMTESTSSRLQPQASSSSPYGGNFPPLSSSSSGGATPAPNPNRMSGRASSASTSSFVKRASGRGTNRRSNSRWASVGGTFGAASSASTPPSMFEPVQQWWTTHVAPNVKSWPKLTCRVEPTTTLKIRKTFRPIGTIVRLGADFNTQLGVWQFKSSWEDAFVGGKLTLAGRELQLTKSWQLSVGAVEDLVTRLRFRAAVDLQTWKGYVRVGFRTERLSPINVMEGFTLLKQVPLDGNKGHVKLEVKANLSLPEPEIEYSTETQRSLVGMGDIEISVEELNLVLDY